MLRIWTSSSIVSLVVRTLFFLYRGEQDVLLHRSFWTNILSISVYYFILFYWLCIGNKLSVSTTHILLMSVVIVLIAIAFELAEKPKRMVVVDKKKPAADKED
jgi:hypothetical protein